MAPSRPEAHVVCMFWAILRPCIRDLTHPYLSGGRNRREVVSSGFTCSVIGRAKENWWQFKESEQGHRFQDRYRRHQENRRGRFDPRTFLSIGAGSWSWSEALSPCPVRGPAG